MYQMNSERQHQPHLPVPICPTPVYLRSSHSQQACLESCHGSPVTYLSSWGTQNLPSVDLTGMQAPQPPSNTYQCYREGLSYTQQYYIPSLTAASPPGGLVGFLPNESQDLQWMASTQTAQPPPGASEYDRGATDDPHKAGTAGDLTAYQLRNPSSSLPQGVAGASAHSSQKPKEEALKKREHRLMKNRKSASQSRIRKKEFMHNLQERLAALETENAKLRARLQLFNNTCPGV